MPRFDIVGQLGSLRRYARSLTRDSADAEDLVHDALVRAYERRATFRSGGNLRAWLLSIVHNAFIDKIRSRRSEAARVEQAGYLTDASTPETISPTMPRIMNTLPTIGSAAAPVTRSPPTFFCSLEKTGRLSHQYKANICRTGDGRCEAGFWHAMRPTKSFCGNGLKFAPVP